MQTSYIHNLSLHFLEFLHLDPRIYSNCAFLLICLLLGIASVSWIEKWSHMFLFLLQMQSQTPMTPLILAMTSIWHILVTPVTLEVISISYSCNSCYTSWVFYLRLLQLWLQFFWFAWGIHLPMWGINSSYLHDY